MQTETTKTGKSNEAKFDAIINEEEKKRAILKVVNELMGYLDPSDISSILDDVLIEWIRKTQSDKSKIESVFCAFRYLNYFLNDLEMVKD